MLACAVAHTVSVQGFLVVCSQLIAHLSSPKIAFNLTPSHKPLPVAFSLSAPVPPAALGDAFIEKGFGNALTLDPLNHVSSFGFT